MDIGKTKYTVNLHFKQGTGETYKDKILKLINQKILKIIEKRGQSENQNTENQEEKKNAEE